MTVADLVGLYEASSIRSTRGSLTGNDRPAPSRNAPFVLSSSVSPPRLARFIRPSHPRPTHPDSLKDGIPLSSLAPSPTWPMINDLGLSQDPPHDVPPESTTDVTDSGTATLKNHDSTLTSEVTTHSARAWARSWSSKLTRKEEDRAVLHNSTHRSVPSSSRSTLSPPNLVHTPHPRSRSHTPVAATTVFARKAAPLHLPKLDNYLASLESHTFSLPTNKEGSDMFPPLYLLNASNKALEDMERNSSIPEPWKSRSLIMSGLVNVVLGLAGSSLLSTFYSLQGLTNTVQIFALILSTIFPVGGQDIDQKWRKLFLGTIPNILALNFHAVISPSLVFLLIFMAIASGLLYYFYRCTTRCDRYNAVEGLRPISRGNGWGLVVVSFLLTLIYLPLSTMAVHVLVWSQDLWVVPNPYVNATSSPPVLPALGPPEQFRDALDFCWTTTMKRNEINFAPLVVLIAVAVFVSLTVWFPVALRRVIKRSVPKVDPFTELGRRRTENEMDREYQRLLARDSNPFTFLYCGFRRGWGVYQSMYLLAKLSALLVVALIDPYNCLFRSLPRNHIAVARQVLLLVSMTGFFLLQCFLSPFVNPIANASEFTSRLNYVATAAVALAVIADTPAQKILNGPVLYAIYILTYGLTAYFLLVDLSVTRRFVKSLARRLDFSIDIFSPRLDLSPASPHAKRRIWQETITALLLTDPTCAIPKDQRMAFAQSRNSDYPPYLLDFSGSPAERHVENLKILREVGTPAYRRAVALITGPDYTLFRHLEEEIQKHFVGPDCYWRESSADSKEGYSKFFGNAWWIPFPPTLVLRYDGGGVAVLREMSRLEAYISQNSSHDIQTRRRIRMSLRAMEGKIATWPYTQVQHIGARSPWCCGRRSYTVNAAYHYQRCVLHIRRRGHLVWEGMQLGSGFEIELTYGKHLRLDGSAIGLNDDYDLTPTLARFLAFNEDLTRRGLEIVQAALDRYRAHQRKECQMKADTLSYRFLSFVYDQPRDPGGIAESSLEFERDPRVRKLMMDNKVVFKIAHDRLSTATRTEATTWWYIFWDDLWRRNYDSIEALRLHAADFNPHYRTCIAYKPLPRSALEAFLTQRGLMSKKPRWSDVFHSGFLNKIYLRLNEAVFQGSSRAIMFHLGDTTSEHDMEDLDAITQGGPSTLGTGGGTEHDDVSIRARPQYRWEGLLNDSWQKGKGIRGKRRNWFAKLGVWMGVTPLWKPFKPSDGIALDLKLQRGRYVLIREEILDSAAKDP